MKIATPMMEENRVSNDDDGREGGVSNEEAIRDGKENEVGLLSILE